MNARSISSASLNMLRLILQVNFNAAVIVVLISSLLSLFGSDLFFDQTTILYGPLVNNLRLILFYLIFVQLAVYGFYYTSNNYIAILILGVFLLLLVSLVEFYCSTNQIEISKNYPKLFLYAGVSNLLYGSIGVLRK